MSGLSRGEQKRKHRQAAKANSSPVDAQETAQSVGLTYVSDQQPGISRRRLVDNFKYFGVDGKRITDQNTLDRVRKLAVPPAYVGVWICTDPNGHLQATGRDARGRKQYRYHETFRAVREGTKYGHMLEFAAALPKIRGRIAEHMALRNLAREKVLATIVHLLETTMIRVGNADYAKKTKATASPHWQIAMSRLTARKSDFPLKARAANDGG